MAQGMMSFFADSSKKLVHPESVIKILQDLA